MLEPGILERFGEIMREEGRLIRLPPDRRVVFVGDTHGDLEATEEVLRRFYWEDTVIVFLGDYVDRGPDSRGNLAALIQAKLAHPERIYLLMGNHEAWGVSPFVPADFWARLPRKEGESLAETLLLLPLAAHHPGGVLALHGAFPDVERIEDIGNVRLGSGDWRKITWSDWAEAPGYVLDPGSFGRPVFGEDFFYEMAERLGIRVLVRAHQPDAPLMMFGDRCLTLFTTHAYGPGPRRVAVLSPNRRIRTARDLEILEI